jgi:cytochrome c-type biogenesis protein CcmE
VKTTRSDVLVVKISFIIYVYKYKYTVIYSYVSPDVFRLEINVITHIKLGLCFE